MAYAAMRIPSMRRCGSSNIKTRSLNVPGSDSSALQTTYFCSPSALAAPSHLMPVGNAAPPRPTSPLDLISSTTCSGFIARAFFNAAYSPYFVSKVVPSPQFAVSNRSEPSTIERGRPSSYAPVSRSIFVSACSSTSAAGACSQRPRQGLASMVRVRSGVV